MTEAVFTAAQGDGGPDDAPTRSGLYGVYYIGKESKLLKFDDRSDSDFNYLNEALWSMMEIDEEKVTPSTSISDFLSTNKKVPPRMMGMAISGYANTVGCCRLSDISLKRTIAYERHWDENDGCTGEEGGECRLIQGMGKVVDVLLKGGATSKLSLVDNLFLNCTIRSVQQQTGCDTVKVTSTSDHVFHTKKVVVSVPLSILQSEDISFDPPLSPSKLQASKMLGFDNAVKLVLIFTERAWPEAVQNCICSDCLVPEMWYRQCPETKLWVCTCFFTSVFADRVVALGKEKATNDALAQLFSMFNIINSDSFVTSEIYNWADIPSIRGGYSHPLPGITRQHVKDLAKAEGNVFFAGEATHTGACMTCHAAMETGVRACSEVLKSLEL